MLFVNSYYLLAIGYLKIGIAWRAEGKMVNFEDGLEGQIRVLS